MRGSTGHTGIWRSHRRLAQRQRGHTAGRYIQCGGGEGHGSAPLRTTGLQQNHSVRALTLSTNLN